MGRRLARALDVQAREKDADSFTPTLFKAKRGRPPKGETTAAPPPVADAEEAPRPAVDDIPPI